jgi:hypothetical protein
MAPTDVFFTRGVYRRGRNARVGAHVVRAPTHSIAARLTPLVSTASGDLLPRPFLTLY